MGTRFEIAFDRFAPWIALSLLAVLASTLGWLVLGPRLAEQPITIEESGLTVSVAMTDQPVALLLDRIKQQEGFRSHPYRDTRGRLTIGYGFNLDAGITQDAAEWLARHHLEVEQKQLAAEWPPYRDQTPAVQAALIDMAYQLGVRGELEFHATLRAVAAGEWETAAQGVEKSKWATETPSRAAWVAGVFRRQQ